MSTIASEMSLSRSNDHAFHASNTDHIPESEHFQRQTSGLAIAEEHICINDLPKREVTEHIGMEKERIRMSTKATRPNPTSWMMTSRLG
jgi:hypothetical protein